MSAQSYLETATGLVFLAAGASKLGPGESLRPFLQRLGVASGVSAGLARTIPVGEVAVGFLLVAGVRPASGGLAVALSLSFLLVQLVAVRAGVRESCRCFGAIDSAAASWVTILRAGTLATLSLAVLYLQLAAPAPPARSAASLAAGAAMAFAYVVGFALADRVHDFEHRRRALFQQPADEDPVPVTNGGDWS